MDQDRLGLSFLRDSLCNPLPDILEPPVLGIGLGAGRGFVVEEIQAVPDIKAQGFRQFCGDAQRAHVCGLLPGFVQQLDELCQIGGNRCDPGTQKHRRLGILRDFGALILVGVKMLDQFHCPALGRRNIAVEHLADRLGDP